jgi:hypothetical protein
MINKDKTNTFCLEPFWKFGVLIPLLVHSQAMVLEKQNGNFKWKEAEDNKKNQLS